MEVNGIILTDEEIERILLKYVGTQMRAVTEYQFLFPTTRTILEEWVATQNTESKNR